MQAEITRDGIAETFATEFGRCWQALPNKGLFFGLLAVWLLLFSVLGVSTFGYDPTTSLPRWMFNVYTHPDSDDEAHGVLVPLVVLGLFWWKRKALMAIPARAWWPALFGVAFALALHVAGFMIQQQRVSIVAMFAGIYFLIGLAWGPRWMLHSFFPFCLLVFCIPVSTLAVFNNHVTLPLRHITATIVAFIAHLGLAPDLIREGTQLYDGQRTFKFDIAPACSGIRGLTTLLLITTVYGMIVFQETWKRLVMIASAVPLAILNNVIRITVTVFVAEAWGQQAGAAVEQKTGFVTFLVIALPMVILLGRLLGDKWHSKSADENTT